MLSTIGKEYIDNFLSKEDLLVGVVDALCTQPTRGFKGLKSIEHLEILADIIEEGLACSSSQSYIIDTTSMASVTANQVISLKNKNKEFLVWSQNPPQPGQSKGCTFKFSYDKQFGNKKNFFAGVITDRPVALSADPRTVDDQIFIVEARRLDEPSFETL